MHMNIPLLRRAGCTPCLIAGTMVLAACGGGVGELILTAFVTPLAGAWRVAGNEANETLQFTTPGPQVHLFSSKFDVEANLLNPVNFCDVQDDGSGQLALAGTFDNGKVRLHAKTSPNKAACIEGSITSLIKLEAIAGYGRPTRSYVNRRVDVQMDLGLWVSDDNGTRLKFSTFDSIDNDEQDRPINACDVSPGATSIVLDGQFDGYQVATDTRPLLAALTAAGQNMPRYTQVEYVDGATLALRNSAGQTVTLRRQKESTITTCAATP